MVFFFLKHTIVHGYLFDLDYIVGFVHFNNYSKLNFKGNIERQADEQMGEWMGDILTFLPSSSARQTF